MSNILGEGKLLGPDGNLCESGYALSQVKTYNRADIKRKKMRIKEWDYYCFCDEDYAVALTVADNSYMSLGSVSVLDFKHLRYVTKSKIGFMPKGKLGMPSSCATGNVRFEKGGVEIVFETNENGERKLSCGFDKFDGKARFECSIELDAARGDNITVAIPFEKKRRFYYNTKINCLSGRGRFTVGDKRHEFVDGYGGLDWGRGVWPYNNTWYWSSLSCNVDGKPFGLNLGYGFGKPTASENVMFYDGKANKIDAVKFDIPYTNGLPDYLKPWKITDDKQRLDILFYPMIDRKDKMKMLWLSTDQHQVFGKFYGKAVLDDGHIVSIVDKVGFAEKVTNKW